MRIDNYFGAFTNNIARLYFQNSKTISERLSSGLRINRAADDPSGLAISSSNRAIINGLDTAIGNIQDGIKMIQTMDGSLAEINDLLQRGRDIAVRAASQALFSDDDLDRMQLEVEGLTSQIDQIANATTYNSKYLLNGGNGATTTLTTQADWQAGTFDPDEIDLVSAPGSVKLQPLDWDTDANYGSGIGIGNQNFMNIWLSGYADNGDGTITATLNIDACINGGGTTDYQGALQLDAGITGVVVNNLTAGTNVQDMGGGLFSFSGGGRKISATNA
ncbi:MAG TPA: flagellin, partial [bacterium]|nr:flagellin [bacterium]